MVPSFNDPEYLADHQGPFMAHAQVCRKFFHMLLWQVAKLGLKVDYGKCMCNYFEDMAAGKGSVVLEVGLIHLADIVIAANSLKSYSEILIAGHHTPTKSSSMSIYCTAYPLTSLSLRFLSNSPKSKALDLTLPPHIYKHMLIITITLDNIISPPVRICVSVKIRPCGLHFCLKHFPSPGCGPMAPLSFLREQLLILTILQSPHLVAFLLWWRMY